MLTNKGAPSCLLCCYGTKCTASGLELEADTPSRYSKDSPSPAARSRRGSQGARRKRSSGSVGSCCRRRAPIMIGQTYSFRGQTDNIGETKPQERHATIAFMYLPKANYVVTPPLVTRRPTRHIVGVESRFLCRMVCQQHIQRHLLLE